MLKQEGRDVQAWLGNLIDLVGDSRFGCEFGKVMYAHMRPDFLHVFRLESDGPRVIESFSYNDTPKVDWHVAAYREQKLWRFDEGMVLGARASTGEPLVVRQGSEAFQNINFRRYRRLHHLGERAMVIGPGQGAAVGFSLSWTKASTLSDEEASWLEQIAKLSLTLMRKHLEFCDQRARLDRALASVPEIEANLGRMIGKRRQREVEVGARLLFGENAAEIARALGIGKETVITHRKRLYDHVGIACARELLLWYLGNQNMIAPN